MARRRACNAPVTLPVEMPGAAYRLEVPECLQSWGARAGVPSSIGRIGAVRSNASISDFSSTHGTTARFGGARYWRNSNATDGG